MQRAQALRASAIGFVVLFAIATLAPGTPPKPNDTGATIKAWVTDHQSGIRWAGWCSLLAGILFLVFALLMREVLGGFAGTTFLVGCIGVSTLTTAYSWFNLGLARRPESVDPATARTLYDIASYWGPLLITFTTLTLGALAWAGLKAGRWPKWVGIVAAVVLAEQLVESITIFGSKGFIAPGGAMNSLLGAGLTVIAWLIAGLTAPREQSA